MPDDANRPPVLLLHGFTTSAERTWREPGWIDLLADAGRSVIAPDLLGHGSSDKPHDPESYRQVEAEVLKHLDGSQLVDAIGYSAGARVLLSLVKTRPEQFRRLVIAGLGAAAVGLAPDQSDGDRPRLDLGPVLRGEREPANPVETRFLTMATSNGNDPLALAAFSARKQPDLTAADIAAVSQPTLIVVGEHDFARPAEPLAEAMVEAEVQVIKGVDHFGLTKAFNFVDRALDFIGGAPTF